MSKECKYFHDLCNKIQKQRFPFDINKIPMNGIYILFENGELAHSTYRIVRIGINKNDNNLQKRIMEHFITENKDRSIFRKNIGRALLNKNKDNYIKAWDIDFTYKKNKELYKDIMNIKKQNEIEKKVTEIIQNNFSFIELREDNKEKRLLLESKIISTVSLCNECIQSEKWLGNYSPKDKIKKSGLWQINELYKTPLNENEIEFLNLKVNKIMK